MKKLFNFFLLTCVMMLASCSSDVEDLELGASGDKITISVGMPGADTRVSTADLLNMTWEDGDKIFLMAYNKDGQYLGRFWGYLQSGEANKKNAKFDIYQDDLNYYKSEGATQYKIYYDNSKYKNEYKIKHVSFQDDKPVVDYSQQIRNKVNDPSRIKETLVLGSKMFPAENLFNGVSLSPENSVLRINLKNLPKSFKEKRIGSIYWKINGVEIGGVDITDLYTIENKDNCYYLAFDPNTTRLSKNGTVQIVVKECKTDGTSVGTATATSKEGKIYKPGKIYTITIADDKEGKWGIIGAAGGSEGDGNEGGGDTKPIDPNAKAWAGKTFWAEGLNVPSKDKWMKREYPSGNELFLWGPGQGWYHCMKVYPSTDHYCWAAASANMIYWWLDRNKDNITKYGKYNGPSVYNSCLDCEIFQYFKDHFNNKGLQIYYAMDWFFKGLHISDNATSNENAIYNKDGSLKWAEHKGFFKDVIPENKVYRTGNGFNFTDEIKRMITNKGVMGIGIDYASGAHALTVYGATFDDNGNLFEIYIVDNDKIRKEGNTNPDEAYPYMTQYEIYTDPNTGEAWVWNWNKTQKNRIYSSVVITSNEAEWKAYFAKQNK